jgi:transcriptional regulator with XRE-family HTH domain
MSQGNLARAAGVTVSTIANLENDRVIGSIPTLRKICIALDLHFDQLLNGTADNPEEAKLLEAKWLEADLAEAKR